VLQLAGNARPKNRQKFAIFSGYVFATKAHVDSRKNLLNSNIPRTCPQNLVNFGLLAAEICWQVWGTTANFKGFLVLAALLYGTSSGRQPNFAALNRCRHLYSAGRPSRWALAHISSSFFFSSSNLRGRRLDVYHTSAPGVALVLI